MMRPEPVADWIEGKYEILGKIREGGMGAVYKVRHRLLHESRVPADLRAVVLRMLAKEPAERFQTAEQIDRELAEIGRRYPDRSEGLEPLLQAASTTPAIQGSLPQGTTQDRLDREFTASVTPVAPAVGTLYLGEVPRPGTPAPSPSPAPLAAVEPRAVTPPPEPLPLPVRTFSTKRPSRLPWVARAAFLVAVLAGGIWWSQRPQNQQPAALSKPAVPSPSPTPAVSVAAIPIPISAPELPGPVVTSAPMPTPAPASPPVVPRSVPVVAKPASKPVLPKPAPEPEPQKPAQGSPDEFDATSPFPEPKPEPKPTPAPPAVAAPVLTQDVIERARLVSVHHPGFPAEAKGIGFTHVVVVLMVNEMGEVIETKVKSAYTLGKQPASKQKMAFVDAAVKAASQARFIPERRAGVPIKSTYELSFDFNPP